MQPSTAPVFAVGGSRILPQLPAVSNCKAAKSKTLTSKPVTSTRRPARTKTARDGGLWANYAGVKPTASTTSVRKYGITDNFSVSLYGAQLEDIWNQYYANAELHHPDGWRQSLNLDVTSTAPDDTGDAQAGDISNTAFSLAAAFSFLKAHTITLASRS